MFLTERAISDKVNKQTLNLKWGSTMVPTPLPQTMRLNPLSKILILHPRTVLRILAKKVNVSWNEDDNRQIDIQRIISILNIKNEDSFARVLAGKDFLLTGDTAPEYVEVQPRTFRYRGYTPLFRRPKIVRYSAHDLVNQHVREFM
jgi:hypothetical protein